MCSEGSALGQNTDDDDDDDVYIYIYIYIYIKRSILRYYNNRIISLPLTE